MIDHISTSNLTLSYPRLEDHQAISQFNSCNKAHLATWESTASTKSTNASPSMEEEMRYLELWIQECHEGKSARFIIRPKSNPELIIGFCNFTQIYQGSFQACYLGYKIDEGYEGKGLMFEALEAAIQYVFEKLVLHRIMANYMPSNARSAALLHRLGFSVEGYAKNYLLINNRWEDHILTSLTVDQWQNPQELSCIRQINQETFIREIRLTDAPALVPLMEQLGYPISCDVMKGNIQRYISTPNENAWVIEKSGKVVGSIAVAITNNFHLPKSFLRVITIVVDKEHRGSSLGKFLMEVAENYASKKGCSQVELTSSVHRAQFGVHDFYRSLGYSEMGNSKSYFVKKMI